MTRPSSRFRITDFIRTNQAAGGSLLRPVFMEARPPAGVIRRNQKGLGPNDCFRRNPS